MVISKTLKVKAQSMLAFSKILKTKAFSIHSVDGGGAQLYCNSAYDFFFPIAFPNYYC